MRRLVVVLAVLSAVMMTGCGGGGGSVSSAPAVEMTIPTSVTSSQPNPVVQAINALSLPAQPEGSNFVAAADCSPAGTTFSAPVTLKFSLASPLAAGATLLLFQTDNNGDWIQVPGSHPIAVSEDRMTLSVNVTKFSDYRYYAIFKVPVP